MLGGVSFISLIPEFRYASSFSFHMCVSSHTISQKAESSHCIQIWRGTWRLPQTTNLLWRFNYINYKFMRMHQFVGATTHHSLCTDFREHYAHPIGVGLQKSRGAQTGL